MGDCTAALCREDVQLCVIGMVHISTTVQLLACSAHKSTVNVRTTHHIVPDQFLITLYKSWMFGSSVSRHIETWHRITIMDIQGVRICQNTIYCVSGYVRILLYSVSGYVRILLYSMLGRARILCTVSQDMSGYYILVLGGIPVYSCIAVLSSYRSGIYSHVYTYRKPDTDYTVTKLYSIRYSHNYSWSCAKGPV